MNKLFTSFLVLMATCINASAQDTPTFTIVDAEGNAIENGAVITVNTWAQEADAETGELKQTDYMACPLQLRKNVENGVSMAATITIGTIDNGTLYEAVGGVAKELTEPTTYSTGYSDNYSELRDIDLRWTPAAADAYGVCEVTVKFDVYERSGFFPPFKYNKVEDGPSVTIRFVNEEPQGTFSIVDAEGNIVNGTTVTVNTWAQEVDPETGELKQADYMACPLQLRKNVENGVSMAATITLTTIDNGTLYEAISGVAKESTEPATYRTGYRDNYSELCDIDLRWSPAAADAYGACEVTVKFDVYERTGIFPPFKYNKVEDGPSVTIRFVNEDPTATAISSSELQSQPAVARYTLGGQLVTSPRRGLNIVRMADGSARKVLVK
ncbi:MAG: hypothetical protein IJ176_08930 [Prevotella sp.]|nr:hypothetical protein [Prevotella sp.]